MAICLCRQNGRMECRSSGIFGIKAELTHFNIRFGFVLEPDIRKEQASATDDQDESRRVFSTIDTGKGLEGYSADM